MYEDNEKKINWLYILKRIIIIIIAIIVIFGVISLVTRCSKKNDNSKVINPEPVTLKAQINDMQDATIKYITKDSLPLEINKTKTIKLKYLINKNLIGELKDAKGTVCDADASYSEITRLENNYALKTSLTCGKSTEYKVIYIGCFDDCKDADICKTTDSKKKGICGDNNKTTTKKNESNNKTTTTKKNGTSQKQYEYRKLVSTNYRCSDGMLTKNNECEIIGMYTYYGKVVPSTTYNTNTYDASVEQVLLKNTGAAKGDSKTTYQFVKYDKNSRKYVYNKYTCKEGTINGKVCTVTTSKTTYGCEDDSYTYNSETNTCSKKALSSRIEKAEMFTSYEYKWSTSTSLTGWEKTGRVK